MKIILGNKIIVLCVLILFVVTLVMIDCSNTESAQNELAQSDTIPLTKHWEIAIPNQVVPKGLVSLSAKDCGSCHSEIYEEWQKSTHAVAFQDLQFQAEWKKDNITVCLNCHTPLQNQQEFIVTGLLNGDYKTPAKTTNPHFDKSLQQESITCASCHVREGNVIGKSGNTNAPHKTVRDAEFLSEKLCISCHNVVDELNPALVCTFETGDEWEKNRASKSDKTCITCHMPEIKREIADYYGIRTSHVHFFPGSGIPKFKGSDVKGLNGLVVKEDSLSPSYKKGEFIRYKLHLKNAKAGHNVPTGDPERYFLVTFTLKDKDGAILKEEKFRIGEEWQWYPAAKKISDNNMQPHEERTYQFDYKLIKKGKIILTVKVTKHRMSEENAKADNLNDYPLFINVFEKQYTKEVY